MVRTCVRSLLQISCGKRRTAVKINVADIPTIIPSNVGKIDRVIRRNRPFPLRHVNAIAVTRMIANVESNKT